MQKLRELAKYPIIIVFFAFLVVFAVIDIVKPDAEKSVFENRNLKQQPTFSLQSFLNNQWTKDFGEYTRDQFLLRDNWVQLQSLAETAQGKLESGDVWLADDGYQIAKNNSWSSQQAAYFPANVEAVSAFAEHYGNVTVMVVPSPANILSAKLPWQPEQIDENALLDEAFAQFNAAGAHVVDLRPAFNAATEAGRQLYYRTDHHWTTDGGAWLAYEAFCEATGQTPIKPNETLRREVSDFYGTSYAKTRYIGTEPDTLVYYDLPLTVDVSELNREGGIDVKTNLPLMDTAKFDEYDKYAAFLWGNPGYLEIEGTGEGSILVIKDSYANSFVPYLTQNYARVCVVDLRTWRNMLSEVVLAENTFDDILVLYSFASFSEDAYISHMQDGL